MSLKPSTPDKQTSKPPSLPEELQPIKTSQSQQEEFKKSIKTRKGYSRTAQAVVQFNSVEQFNDFFLKPVQDDQAKFEAEHHQGAKGVARSYQNASAKAGEFVKQFSPILEMVQSCGSPYGGIAIGVMSVLFVVAASKNALEERLMDTIAAIMDRLPGIEMYKRLYNDNDELDTKLQAHIALVYEAFMAFCIKASEYYNRSGSRRWLQVFLGSSKAEDEADNVQKLVVEMRMFCEELLAKNVDQIKQLNIEQTRELAEQSRELAEQSRKLQLIETQNTQQRIVIDRLEAELSGLRASKDEDNVREVQRLLKQDTFSEEDLVQDFCNSRDILERNIKQYGQFFQQMQGFTLQSFRSCDEHQRWASSPEACLLAVVGYNHPRAAVGIDECWLSPIAYEKISDSTNEDLGKVCAYYVFPPRGALLYEALSVIFIQLLRKQNKVLRASKKYDNLVLDLLHFNSANNFKLTKGSQGGTVAAFQKVAARVIDLFEEGTEIEIIFDRADRCEIPRDQRDHRKNFMKILVRMTEEAGCKLKTLVVFNGGRWNLTRHQDELEITKPDRFVVYTAHQGMIA